MWIRHHIQLWEGLLHFGWVGTGWWAAGDQQEECTEGHRCPGPAARGQ